jgi:PhnB protein
MTNPIPYLSFNGNCAEAVRFYEQVLGGKIEMMMDGASSPMAADVPKEFAHRIIHARLALPDGGVIYAGDTPAHLPYEGIKGITLTLSYDTVDQARRIFDKLAAGGQVNMAMAPTFWAKAWGMLVDKYGVAWMVNGEVQPM